MAEQERIELRLSPEHKRIIEQAAALKGHNSVSGYAVVELLERAREIVDENEVRLLSKRDWERFNEVLDGKKPNAKLEAAAEAFRKKRGA